LLPDIHFGEVGNALDWRGQLGNEPDDDEILFPSPDDVIEMLGFDPLVLMNESVSAAALGKGGPGSGPHPGGGSKAKDSHAALIESHEQIFESPIRMGHSITGEVSSVASPEEISNYKGMLHAHLAEIQAHGKAHGMPPAAKSHLAQASNALMTRGHTVGGREAALMSMHNAIRAIGHAVGSKTLAAASRSHDRRPNPPTLAKRSQVTVGAEQKMRKTLSQFLTSLANKLAEKIRAHGMEKAAPPKTLLNDLLEIDWEPLADEIAPSLTSIAKAGSSAALAQLKITDDGLIASANKVAGKWAEKRSAEMIGKRRVDGRLVENPNARWSIAETTRQEIHDLVTKAFETNTKIEDLADQIKEAGGFSDSRAEMIARTEAIAAEGQGNLIGWRESEVVGQVDWVMSADHSDDNCECPDNEDGSPYDIDDVPDFPAHPNCWCALIPVLNSEE
jgi:hypothetical protein